MSVKPIDLIDAGKPPRLGSLRVILLAAIVMTVGALIVGAFSRVDRGHEVAADDLLPTTVPTVPDPLQPVDPSTLENGYYLEIAPPIFTGIDESLLAAAKTLLLEAQAAGYVEAKLVKRPATKSSCDEHGCGEGMPPVGYLVLLKGPIAVPAGLTEGQEYDWRREVWLKEVDIAKSRGLTAEPSIYWYDFG